MHSPTQSPLADATAHIKSAIPAESAVHCIGGVIGKALLLSSVAHPRCPVHARNCTASTMHLVNAPRTARKPGIQKKQGELYRVYKIFCTALSPKSECAEKCSKVMRSAMHLPESNATPLDLFPFSTEHMPAPYPHEHHHDNLSTNICRAMNMKHPGNTLECNRSALLLHSGRTSDDSVSMHDSHT